MLTYIDLNMPKQLGVHLSMTANEIISIIHRTNKTFAGATLKYNKIQVDVSPSIVVHLEIMNEDTVKFTMCEHEVMLQGEDTTINYLDKHVSRYDSTLVGPIAYRISMTLHLLTIQ